VKPQLLVTTPSPEASVTGLPPSLRRTVLPARLRVPGRGSTAQTRPKRLLVSGAGLVSEPVATSHQSLRATPVGTDRVWSPEQRAQRARILRSRDSGEDAARVFRPLVQRHDHRDTAPSEPSRRFSTLKPKQVVAWL